MAKLRAIKAKNLELPGRYGDGDSLYLSVAPGGSKSWVQRIPVDGKRRNLGLGGYPAVSLAEARDRTVANKRAVRQGRNPVSVRKSSSQTAKTTAPTPCPGDSHVSRGGYNRPCPEQRKLGKRQDEKQLVAEGGTLHFPGYRGYAGRPDRAH